MPRVQNDALMSRAEAQRYSGFALNTLKKYTKSGDLEFVTVDGVRFYSRTSIDALRKKLESDPNVRHRLNKKPATKARSIMPIDDGFPEEDEEDEAGLVPPARDVYEMLGVGEDATQRDIVAAMQRYVIDTVLKQNVIQTYLNDLESEDWRCRHAAADKLLSLVFPKVKSTEVIHRDSEEKTEQRERSLELLADIKKQIAASRQLPAPESVRVIEVERENV